VSDEELKLVVLKANEFLSSLEAVTKNLTDEDREKLKDLASRPVGLRDIASFNVSINIVSHEDLKKARRELVSAISAEKWLEGFGVALKVMALFGGA